MKTFSFFCFLLICSNLEAATYYTRSTGDITGSIWGTTTTGTGGALPALASGDVLYIDDNITITTNFTTWSNVDITIYLNATIDITSGKLDMGLNSKIIFQSTAGKLVSTSPGNSDKVRFGNITAWDSNSPDLTGPGTLDKTSNGVLPISLLFFKLNSVSSEGILFDWATASELNFDHFNVQRSFNGKDFETIAVIKGNGTTRERHDYSYMDKFPVNGASYYRIQSTDFDGYTETFNVVSVKFEGGKEVALYPNPVTDSNLNFQLNFQPVTEILVTVTSVTGIERVREVIKANETNINFGLSLEPGVYIVKMASLDFNKISRIVVK
jgi:hypothetical protein